MFFKIGAVTDEPTASLDGLNWLRLDLDKGVQSAGGDDMHLVGDLANTRTCPDDTYEIKTFGLASFSVTSTADGSLWVILGTDSGFEGTTTYYLDSIEVTLRPATLCRSVRDLLRRARKRFGRSSHEPPANSNSDR